MGEKHVDKLPGIADMYSSKLRRRGIKYVSTLISLTILKAELIIFQE